MLGSIVNMALIMLSGKVIPPPTGADVTTMEGLRAALHLFEPKHFIFPFLAHAVGTFVGATVSAAVGTTIGPALHLVVFQHACVPSVGCL
jgi:hypothetical protein